MTIKEFGLTCLSFLSVGLDGSAVELIASL